jgi:hypothetical protein
VWSPTGVTAPNPGQRKPEGRRLTALPARQARGDRKAPYAGGHSKGRPLEMPLWGPSACSGHGVREYGLLRCQRNSGDYPNVAPLIDPETSARSQRLRRGGAQARAQGVIPPPMGTGQARSGHTWTGRDRAAHDRARAQRHAQPLNRAGWAGARGTHSAALSAPLSPAAQPLSRSAAQPSVRARALSRSARRAHAQRGNGSAPTAATRARLSSLRANR